MRVLIAPDKFRDTFTAAEVCAAIERGLLQADPAIRVDSAPLADGGEGTLDVMLAARSGARLGMTARGPLGDEIHAEYGVTPDGTAIIESARFCGLHLIPPGRRDPMKASSYGLGQAVASALDMGLREFLIGLGGSATVDGGVGMARALGFRLLDSAGRDVSAPGGDLSAMTHVDASMAHQGLATARFTALCDVDSPLLGPQGAAAVYGPQKGASPPDVARLEQRLSALGSALAGWRGAELVDAAILPGAGAAGGLGLGCAAFLGANLTSGATFFMKMLGLAERIGSVDLVITGEGSFDSQSGSGKVVAAVLEEAARQRKPAVVVAGRWDGSLPRIRPESMEVLTAQNISGSREMLSLADLVEVGRRIAIR